MSKKKGGKHKVLWGFIYVLVFIIAFGASALIKMTHKPVWSKEYTVDWNDSVGTKYTDLSYGEADANRFDLYLPADNSRESYGLVVYLHAGGFTTGDKADDHAMLEWLCSKGYVAAGINYTLRDANHPETSVYMQTMEIKQAMPVVIKEAARLGYPINEMSISGGSAGHCLAMVYAYRDAKEAPVPVRMVFGAVGPSSFYPEDWTNYGFDKGTDESKQAAAYLFGIMAGKEITPDMFGTPAYDEAMKDISALLWVDDDTVPSLLCYGAHDRVQPFAASVRLDAALTAHNIPHDYIVCEHSGHGLQNDSRQSQLYYQKIVEYLDTYMPVRYNNGLAGSDKQKE